MYSYIPFLLGSFKNCSINFEYYLKLKRSQTREKIEYFFERIQIRLVVVILHWKSYHEVDRHSENSLKDTTILIGKSKGRDSIAPKMVF